MNYAKHYALLIDRSKLRCIDGYSERHHIVPKCMGGSNEPHNITRLTAEEHFVAHQLLTKMHPESRHLAHAAKAMAKNVTGRKAYAWLRKRHASLLKGNTFNVGRKASDEARANISKALIGNRNGVGNTNRVGKKHTEATRALISINRIGKPSWWNGKSHSLEARLKISERKKGRKASIETRLKMSATRKGRKFSALTRARMSEAQKRRFALYAAH